MRKSCGICDKICKSVGCARICFARDRPPTRRYHGKWPINQDRLSSLHFSACFNTTWAEPRGRELRVHSWDAQRTSKVVPNWTDPEKGNWHECLDHFKPLQQEKKMCANSTCNTKTEWYLVVPTFGFYSQQSSKRTLDVRRRTFCLPISSLCNLLQVWYQFWRVLVEVRIHRSLSGNRSSWGMCVWLRLWYLFWCRDPRCWSRMDDLLGAAGSSLPYFCQHLFVAIKFPHKAALNDTKPHETTWSTNINCLIYQITRPSLHRTHFTSPGREKGKVAPAAAICIPRWRLLLEVGAKLRSNKSATRSPILWCLFVVEIALKVRARR